MIIELEYKKRIDKIDKKIYNKNMKNKMFDLPNYYVSGANYFNRLPREVQQIFVDQDYLPMNFYDADNFIKSIYNVGDKDSFEVDLKDDLFVNGKNIEKVVVSNLDPFDAFVPQVWNSMTISQKLNTISMTFEYYCNRVTYTKNHKPKLMFMIAPFSKATKGFYAPKQDILYISFYHILNNKLAYLDIVSTIAHELTHKRQYHEIDQLKKHGVKYEEMNDYYKSLYFFRSEKFMNKLNNIIFNWFSLDTNPEEYIKRGIFSSEQVEMLKNIRTSREIYNEWTLLLNFIYSNHPIEVGAQNSEKKHYYQILNQRLEKYNLQYPFNSKSTASAVNGAYLFQRGYLIDDEDINNLEKLNVILSNTDDEKLIMEGLKYLLDVMIEKEVTKKVDFVNYNEFIDNLIKKEQAEKQIENQMVD